MINLKLIDILKSLPEVNVEKYGYLIDFGTIYQTCSLHGQDVKEIIEQRLIGLEKEGLLTVVYDNQPGFEDFIIGVKLADYDEI